MADFMSKTELHKIICKNIKKYRIRKGLTQEELSERIDISYDYLRRLESEKGQKDFTFYTLYKISVVLNIPIDAFVVEEPEI